MSVFLVRLSKPVISFSNHFTDSSSELGYSKFFLVRMSIGKEELTETIYFYYSLLPISCGGKKQKSLVLISIELKILA